MEHFKSVRRPRRLIARFLTVGLMGAAIATVGFVGTAAANTIQFTGQGTDNGACGMFEGQPPPAGGTQTWQFNLTQTMPGATITASFSDGTSVTNQAESDHNGKTSFFFIATAAGAKVISATATFTPDGENSQFVVSHCTRAARHRRRRRRRLRRQPRQPEPGGGGADGWTANCRGPGGLGARLYGLITQRFKTRTQRGRTTSSTRWKTTRTGSPIWIVAGSISLIAPSGVSTRLPTNRSAGSSSSATTIAL